jgi:hypothetical protein
MGSCKEKYTVYELHFDWKSLMAANRLEMREYIWIILLRVVPLLCNDRDIGGYTRTVSGQRLGKHVPIARQQILNNATVGLQQWNRRVFYVVSAERL